MLLEIGVNEETETIEIILTSDSQAIANSRLGGRSIVRSLEIHYRDLKNS